VTLWVIKDTKKGRGWWRPGSSGYTQKLEDAGRFDVVELMDITLRSTRGDFIIEIAPEVNAYPCVECGEVSVIRSDPYRCLKHFRKHHGIIGGD
tara:strand:+ start:9479 stop:9760 length:282 start_codon:yes stop_codon:yes gene_type:complete